VRCRAEYEELAEVPVFLDLITAEEAAGAERPPGQAPVAHEKVRKSTEQEAFGSSEVRLPRRQVPPLAEPDARSRLGGSNLLCFMYFFSGSGNLTEMGDAGA
jgi:hypothetical protein